MLLCSVVVGKPPTIFALLSPMDALISTVIVSIVTLLLGIFYFDYRPLQGHLPHLRRAMGVAVRLRFWLRSRAANQSHCAVNVVELLHYDDSMEVRG